MCKMLVVIRRECLGNRETGWSLWTGKDVMETTAKTIKDMIKSGTFVAGLRIGKDGELELDNEGFYTTNLIEHRAAGNYKPMITGDMMANVMYTVIGIHQEDGIDLCDCISSKFEQVSLTADDVKSYIKLGLICSGAKIEGENVIVADVNPTSTDSVSNEEDTVDSVNAEEPVEIDKADDGAEALPEKENTSKKSGGRGRKRS
ncbi:MAG: hypothetical protein IKO16_05735 [Lachnospiraceae bacterium]|nr:hypothetical protein [Lachnospiraceae bacterium]